MDFTKGYLLLMLSLKAYIFDENNTINVKIKYKDSYITKGKNKTFRRNTNIKIEHQKIYEIIFLLLFFINLFVLVTSKNEFSSFNYKLNYITLKVNGTGYKKVFHTIVLKLIDLMNIIFQI